MPQLEVSKGEKNKNEFRHKYLFGSRMNHCSKEMLWVLRGWGP